MAISLLRRMMELEVEGRRPVGRPKTTWSKVVEEDMRKLNVTEDMAEDRKQWRQLVSLPIRSGKLGTLNENHDDFIFFSWFLTALIV